MKSILRLARPSMSVPAALSSRSGAVLRLTVLLAICATAIFSPTGVAAQAPFYAPFAHQGALDLDLGHWADLGAAVAVDSSGRILVAGSTVGWGSADEDVIVFRLQPDGQIDSTFGFYGFEVLPFDIVPGANDAAVAIAIDSHDRIVVLGRSLPPGAYASDQHAWGNGVAIGLARILPNGGLDSSFGQGGILTETLSSSYTSVDPTALAITGNTLVVGGTIKLTASDNDWFVARFAANGALDPSFYGGFGYRQIWFDLAAGFNDRLRDIAIASNGDIVAAGLAEEHSGGGNTSYLALTRLDANGATVASFGGNTHGIPGATLFSNSSGPIAIDETSIVLDDEDGIVAASRIWLSSTEDGMKDELVAITKFTSGGQLDTSFANGGSVNYRFDPNYSAIPNDIVRLADGRLVVVGYRRDQQPHTQNRWMGVLRLQSNGSPDPTFAASGSQPGAWAGPFILGQVQVNAYLQGAFAAPNGVVYAAGSLHGFSNGWDIAVVALTPN